MEQPNHDEVWFYIKDRQQEGPVGMFELIKLFEQGVLNENTYLWTESEKSWKLAKSLDPFKDVKVKPLHVCELHDQTQDMENLESVTYPKGRPLVRFIARMFDLSIFTLLFITFISIFSPDLILKVPKLALFMISIILWLFIEPIVLSIFGNTLGRSLLNTKIKNVNGEYIDFRTAFKRSGLVIAVGMGFGVPIITFICFLLSYFDLSKHDRSRWDEKTGTITLYGNIGLARILLASCFPLAIFLTGLIIP